ncbi:MAG: caspase family protein [Hyphomicrobiaceae bacterium]
MRPILALLATLWILAGTTPVNAERRVALVVGNSAYTHTVPLDNPRNDAADMKKALTAVGFDVVSVLDADKRAMDQAVRTFADKLPGADIALFFYAGHGLQVGLQNYLVPTDAQLQRERDLEFEAVKLEQVQRQMEIDREGKTSIVILDACRDNPLSRNLARSMGTRSTAIGRGLAAAATGLGTFIAYATQPGNVALDGVGKRNSPFTAALLKQMRTAGRNLPATMIEVRKEVVARTSGRQVPWDHSALTGDFYFVPSTSAPAAPVPAETASVETSLQKLERDVGRLTKAAPAARPGIPPILPKTAGSEPRASFTRDENVRIDGNVIAQMRQPNPDACRAECDATAACIGYQHGRKIPVMGQCQLFDRIDQRQQDPAWRSGVIETAPGTAGTARNAAVALVPPNLLFSGQKARTERGFTVYDRASLDGRVIKKAAADTRQACGVVCRNTPGCVAASYVKRRGWREACTVLETVTGATSGQSDATALFRRD